MDADPWLQLRNTPSPTTVSLGGVSTLTADIYGRNAGGPLPNCPGASCSLNNLPPFAITFNNATKGTLSGAGTQLVNGQATATFTAGGVSASCGMGGADAVVDSQTVNAAVTVQCPDLTAAKTNNVANAAVTGQSWTWTITVTNGGNGAATFPTSSTILSDNLPNAATISYGSPTPSIAGVSCTINGSKDLTCTATSPVTLAASGGSFNVQFTAVAAPPGTAPGTYTNPRGGGTATVDPNDAVVESNEGNNAIAANSVVVSKANTNTTITNAATLSSTSSSVGQSYAVNASVTVNSPGNGTPTGTITVSDGTDTCTITLPGTSCNLTSTTRGAKTITATYNNDANFNASPASAGVSHSVFAPPTIAKVFSPTSIALTGTSTLTLTITNPAGNPAGSNGIAVSDAFPAGLEVGTTPAATNTCGGTFNPLAGATSISLSGGAIASAGGTCAISVKVKGTTAGNKSNTTGTISSTEGGTGLTANATLNVVAPPTIAKAFSPSAVPVNGTSTLTFTITNPAANTVALTGVGFTDNFPAGLAVATPLTTTNTCGGSLQDNGGGALTAGDAGIKLVGGTVGINSTCTISVNVTPTVQGPFNNVTGNISSTNGGTGNTASATLITNLPPVVNPVAVTVMAGSPSAPQLLANVSDDMTPNASLTATINSLTSATVNGVTISGLTINAAGQLSGTVVAACTATSSVGLFTLNVTDGAGATTNQAFNVTVNANTPPTLSYANVAAGLNQMLIVMPASGPSDNGSITSITASASAGFSGTVAVNPLNGKVTINNAGPLGNYTITVKATDNCGEMTTTSFTLTVIPFLVKLSDPILCLGANNTLSVHAEVTNPNAVAANLNFNATIAPPLSGVAGTCVSSLGNCTISANGVNVTGLLPGNQTVLIDYKVLVADGTPQGTNLCIDSTASFNGGPLALVQACTVLNCPAFPADVRVSDQKAGSVLVFPYYTSNAAAKKDTRLTLSNSGTEKAYVHIFFLDGATCEAADQFLCLTPNASISFKASEYDPEMTGWLLAVAVDSEGLPVNNNVLIGNAFVKDGEYVDNYGAEAFRANSQALAVVNDFTATLFFDGGSYDAVPSQFAAEIQSPVDAPGQRVVTVSLRGDLTTSQLSGASQVGAGQVFNGNEKPSGSFSAFLSGKCQAIATISTTIPRVPNGMGVMIPSGQVGTLKFTVGASVGLLMTPRTNNWKGIRTLHKTGLTTSTLTIPLIRPVC